MDYYDDDYGDYSDALFSFVRERLRGWRYLERASDSDDYYSDDYDGDYSADEEIYYDYHVVHGERPDGQSLAPSPRERALQSRPLPDDCAFLAPWMRVLDGLFVASDAGYRDSHDVRIGRGPSDWWIPTVPKVRPFLTTQTGSVESDARRLREALYVTSLAAEIDYEAWAGEFLQLPSRRFRVPQDIHLETHEIPRQFEIKFGAGQCLDVVNKIHKMFIDDDGSASAEFEDACAKLRGLAKARKCEFPCDRGFRVSIRLSAYAAAGANINHVVRMIDAMAEIVRVSNQNAGRTTLRLKGVILRLSAVTMTAQMLNALNNLLTTGVRVHLLELPLCPSLELVDTEEAIFVRLEMMQAWTSLLHALLLSQVTVDHLRWNVSSIEEDLILPSFSALFCARGVRRLTIVRVGPKTPRVFWSWLAFALFSCESTSSVTSLALKEVDFTDGVFVDYVDSFQRAHDPMMILWHVTGTRSKSSNPANTAQWFQVALNKGVIITLLSSSEENTTTTTLQQNQRGFLMDSCTGRSAALLFVPSIGFCEVNWPSLASKKRRAGASIILQLNCPSPTKM